MEEGWSYLKQELTKIIPVSLDHFSIDRVLKVPCYVILTDRSRTHFFHEPRSLSSCSIAGWHLSCNYQDFPRNYTTYLMRIP